MGLSILPRAGGSVMAFSGSSADCRFGSEICIILFVLYCCSRTALLACIIDSVAATELGNNVIFSRAAYGFCLTL